ncbi:hypothetical protein ZWY2020_045976 [Hordeum vulgare]|uniref:F-box domain-containing protein n=1 Tax=Hordeum vulgare subsp. vulgare TaxID=112509 RepID=A0A8I6WQ32_HORVV|nr:hypothetical protein ZWY2020_045976 [Hordeum vulgare]
MRAKHKPLGRRRRRPQRRADAGVILPPELVLEILERASPSTAVRCAATCRPWRRLVSRRSFVRRASRPRRALLLGFFVFDHAADDDGEEDHAMQHQPGRFVPRPGGPAGWRCPCTPRLDPRCLDPDLDPVLSRNGYLVLSRVTLAKPGPGDTAAINYCVCNPATGSCSFLPPYHVDPDIGFWDYTCALLTGRDLDLKQQNRDASFELVVAAIRPERQELLVSVFSSRTMQWGSTRALGIPPCFIDSEQGRHPDTVDGEGRAWSVLEMHPRNPPAVHHGGTILWQCTCDCTERAMLALDLDPWRVTLLDLPNDSPCSGRYWDLGLVLGCRDDDDGVIRAYSLAEGGSCLRIWDWAQVASRCGDVWMWRLSDHIGLRMAISNTLTLGAGDLGIKLLWYCDKSNVLVFTTAALGSFALNLDTGRADSLGNVLGCTSEFCATNACIWWRACPYEIECPPCWIT